MDLEKWNGVCHQLNYLLHEIGKCCLVERWLGRLCLLEVPQGSVLAPVMIYIYVNYIVDSLSSYINLYGYEKSYEYLVSATENYRRL